MEHSRVIEACRTLHDFNYFKAVLNFITQDEGNACYPY